MRGMLAAPVAPARMAGRWLVFRCGERQWGLALEAVREILTPQAFTRIPGCGPEVAGLIGVRGRVVTVFDLGVLLAFRSAAALPDHRILLVDVDERVLGLAVDDATAVLDAELCPLPPEEDRLEGLDPDASHVFGTGEADGITFTVADLDALVGGLLA